MNPSRQITTAAASTPPAPGRHPDDEGKSLGTIGDKEGAFKGVILRDAVSVTENLNTHYRLYLRPHYARPRTKTKCAALASNPTPSAISVSSAFREFPVQIRGKIGQLSVKVSVTPWAVPEFLKIPHYSAILRHCSLSVFSSCPDRKGTNAKPIHSIPVRCGVLLRRPNHRPAKKFADAG